MKGWIVGVILGVVGMFTVPVAIAVYQDPEARADLLNNISISQPEPNQDNIVKIESAILDLINEERNNADLRAVTYDEILEAASTQFASMMVKQGFFDHIAPDGSTVDSIARDLDYNCNKAPYYAVADNLAQGGAYFGQYSNEAIATHTVNSWMNSEGHRANILTSSHNEIGVGIAYDDDIAYIVLSFC